MGPGQHCTDGIRGFPGHPILCAACSYFALRSKRTTPAAGTSSATTFMC